MFSILVLELITILFMFGRLFFIPMASRVLLAFLLLFLYMTLWLLVRIFRISPDVNVSVLLLMYCS